MHIKQYFELSMVLDYERFHKVLSHVYHKADCMEKEEYIDQSLEEKGIIVVYRNSQYKKKIKLIVNVDWLYGGNKPDPDRLTRKLNKQIGEYFDHKYTLNDFFISEMRLITDINVESHENVAAYLKVLQRIGREKGFSPVSYECLENIENFSLEGNSNGIDFLLYDLESVYQKHFKENDIERKKLKTIIKEAQGILRAEVRLTKQKAVHSYADGKDICKQIAELSEKSQDIFLEIFVRIIPFGNFYKKDKAIEIIRQEITDDRLRRRMIRLATLIPEKKSLYLAQKAMKCRNIEKVMESFAKINVSPVTISKRQDEKCLKNIYAFICLINSNMKYI